MPILEERISANSDIALKAIRTIPNEVNKMEIRISFQGLPEPQFFSSNKKEFSIKVGELIEKGVMPSTELCFEWDSSKELFISRESKVHPRVPHLPLMKGGKIHIFTYIATPYEKGGFNKFRDNYLDNLLAEGYLPLEAEMECPLIGNHGQGYMCVRYSRGNLSIFERLDVKREDVERFKEWMQTLRS